MSIEISIKEGDPNESTPTKSLHELTPLRSVVAPQRCHLSSVCGGKDKKNSRYRQIFRRKNAKKIARTLSQHTYVCKLSTNLYHENEKLLEFGGDIETGTVLEPFPTFDDAITVNVR